MKVNIIKLKEISQKIETIARNLRVFRENVAMFKYHELSEDIEYIFTVLASLDIDVNMFIELIKLVNGRLSIMDYTGAADTLSYEINPVIIELVTFFEESEYAKK